MKTIINCGNEKLIISNDELDGYNFVDLQFEDEKGETTEELTVSIDDLMSALIGFDSIKCRSIQREKDFEV